MKQQILALALAVGLSSGVSAQGLPFEINDVVDNNGLSNTQGNTSGLSFGPANNFVAVYSETVDVVLNPQTGTGTFDANVVLALTTVRKDTATVVIPDNGGDSVAFKSLDLALYSDLFFSGDVSFTPTASPTSLSFSNFRVSGMGNRPTASLTLDNRGDTVQANGSVQLMQGNIADDVTLFSSTEISGLGLDDKDGLNGRFAVTFSDLAFSQGGANFFGIEHDTFRVDGSLPGDQLFSEFEAQASVATPDSNGLLNFQIQFNGEATARFIKVNAPAGVALFGLGLIGLARLRRNA